MQNDLKNNYEKLKIDYKTIELHMDDFELIFEDMCDHFANMKVSKKKKNNLNYQNIR